MSDGNTATTLAPSEDDMRKVREVFDAMRDTVINSSQLAGEVAALRGEVASLRSEIQAARESNHWLDSQVTELRQQRDQATRDKQAALDELNKTKLELHNTSITVDNQRGELHRLNEEVARLKRERDDAEMRAMGAEEQANEFNAVLDSVQRLLNPPKPTEQPRSETGQFQAKPQDERPWESQKPNDEYPF